MVKEYGPVVNVSLTDNRGREKVATDLFGSMIRDIPDVEFAYFDFHHECANMRWENIDNLIENIQQAINSIGWSKVTGDNVDAQQRGIVRTNCIDCLDRTNVVQSMIAHQILERQLAEIGITFDCLNQFRGIWADNADAISVQYAGTPALKNDFTRTGKRSRIGVIIDRANSWKRYYVNTVLDGTMQDAYDVATQTVQPVNYKRGKGFCGVLIAIFIIFLIYSFTRITKGKNEARERIQKRKIEAVNRPSIRDAEIRQQLNN
jgi:hypothetical protein